MLRLFFSSCAVEHIPDNPFILADELDDCLDAYLHEFDIPGGEIPKPWRDVYYARSFVKDLVNGRNIAEFCQETKFERAVLESVRDGLNTLDFPELSGLFQQLLGDIDQTQDPMRKNIDKNGNFINQELYDALSGYHSKFSEKYDDQKYQRTLPASILNLDNTAIVAARLRRPSINAAALRFCAARKDLQDRKTGAQIRTFSKQYLPYPVNVLGPAAGIHNRIATLCLNAVPSLHYEGMVYDGRWSDTAPKNWFDRMFGKTIRSLRAAMAPSRDLRAAIASPPWQAGTREGDTTYYRIETDAGGGLVCDNGSSMKLYAYRQFRVGALMAAMEKKAYSDAIAWSLEAKFPRNLILVIGNEFPNEYLSALYPVLHDNTEAMRRYLIETKTLSDDGLEEIKTCRSAKLSASGFELFADAGFADRIGELNADQLETEWQELSKRLAADVEHSEPLVR